MTSSKQGLSPQENLIGAIIRLALLDTKNACPEVREDAFNFLRSDYCEDLCGINGESLLRLYHKFGKVVSQYNRGSQWLNTNHNLKESI